MPSPRALLAGLAACAAFASPCYAGELILDTDQTVGGRPHALLARAGAYLSSLARGGAPPALPPPPREQHLAAASILLAGARSHLDALEATLLGPLKMGAANGSAAVPGNASAAAPHPPPPARSPGPAPPSGPPALAALAALALLSYAAASAVDALRVAAGPAVSAAFTLARAPVGEAAAAAGGGAATATTTLLPPLRTARTRARRALRALRPAARDCAEALTRLVSHGVLIVALARHLAAARRGGSGSGGGLGGAAGWFLSAFEARGPATAPTPGQAMLLCAAGWAAMGWAASDVARWVEEAGGGGWAGEAAAPLGRLLFGRGPSPSTTPVAAAAAAAGAGRGGAAPATPTGADLARLARARLGAGAGRQGPGPPPLAAAPQLPSHHHPHPLAGWGTRPLGAGAPAPAAGAPASPFARVSFGGGGGCFSGGRPRRHSAGVDGGDSPPPSATRARLPPPPRPGGRGGPPSTAEPCTDLPACRICWVAPRAVAFLPCGHVGACAACTLRLFGGGEGGGPPSCASTPCPFCGQAVADVARVFVV